MDTKKTGEKQERAQFSAEDLRAARKAAGLSIVKAAELSGTPYRTWQEWEGNKNRVPGIVMSWLDLYVKLHS